MDTSSLLKLFLEEERSDWVRAWAEKAEVLAASRVAYPEAMAGAARRWRDGDLDDDSFDAVREALNSQWQDFSVVDLDEKAAGALAVKHGIRGFDAIHLAAALELRSAIQPVPLYFDSFDRKLNAAAKSEKLMMLSTAMPELAGRGTGA